MMWTRWDGTGTRDRAFISPDTDEIYYYRQYVIGAGYKRSESNNLILNFKKSPTRPQAELQWKDRAIRTFIRELGALLKDIPKSCRYALTWIPPSKSKDHEEYDNRLEQVARGVARNLSHIDAIETITTTQSRSSLHSGARTRSPEYLKSTFQWCPCDLHPFSVVLILDDTLTTGCSYRATSETILSRFDHLKPVGIFWAIAIDDVADNVFGDIEF